MTTRSLAERRAAVALWMILGAATSSPARADESSAPARAPALAPARAPALAPALSECLALHGRAQELRRAGKLLEGRKALRSCSMDACPSLVRADCLAWLEEVERTVPSVTFEGVLNGRDVVNVRVSEGDRVLAETLTGSAVELDPGVHKFQATMPGQPSLESTYLLREGEKSRVVRLDFTPPAVFAPPSSGVEVARPRPVPATFYVFGAIAVASGVVGTTLGALALNERGKLTCKPLCTDSDVQPVRRLALAADVGFGTAVISAALAAYFLVTRPEIVPADKDKGTAVKVAPTALFGLGFGGFGARGSF